MLFEDLDTPEFKRIFGQYYDKPPSDQEAYEGAYDLINAFKWLVGQDEKQKSKNKEKIRGLKELLGIHWGWIIGLVKIPIIC